MPFIGVAWVWIRGPYTYEWFWTLLTQKCTRWWFQRFFIFIPTWGNDPIWRAYFSNGLKLQPSESRWQLPTRSCEWRGAAAASTIFGSTLAVWDLLGNNGRWWECRWRKQACCEGRGSSNCQGRLSWDLGMGIWIGRARNLKKNAGKNTKQKTGSAV